MTQSLKPHDYATKITVSSKIKFIAAGFLALLAVNLVGTPVVKANETTREFYKKYVANGFIGSATSWREVSYKSKYRPGTIVISTKDHTLHLVKENGRAIEYKVGVGREGFQWSGRTTVSRKAEWPTWTPTPRMRREIPTLPVSMEGGEDNPLGARALYLGLSLYRIHGTNQPTTIGRDVSSGCIRMMNADVIDLYERVKIGTPVVVLR